MRKISGGEASEARTVAERCVFVSVGVREAGERLKVTDVSSLKMRNMISSLPVIQMCRP